MLIFKIMIMLIGLILILLGVFLDSKVILKTTSKNKKIRNEVVYLKLQRLLYIVFGIFYICLGISLIQNLISDHIAVYLTSSIILISILTDFIVRKNFSIK